MILWFFSFSARRREKKKKARLNVRERTAVIYWISLRDFSRKENIKQLS